MAKKYIVRLPFPDGDEFQSLADHEYALLLEAARMAVSAEPEMREKGRARLRDVAKHAAHSRQAKAENTESAKRSAESRAARKETKYQADLKTAVEAAGRLIARGIDPTAESIAEESKSKLKLRRVNEFTVYRIRTLAE
jgi:hypothetical protein